MPFACLHIRNDGVLFRYIAMLQQPSSTAGARRKSHHRRARNLQAPMMLMPMMLAHPCHHHHRCEAGSMAMLVMTKANPAIHWGCWVMPLMLSTSTRMLRRIERTTLYQLQISQLQILQLQILQLQILQLQILQHRSSTLLTELDKSTSLVESCGHTHGFDVCE